MVRVRLPTVTSGLGQSRIFNITNIRVCGAVLNGRDVPWDSIVLSIMSVMAMVSLMPMRADVCGIPIR